MCRLSENRPLHVFGLLGNRANTLLRLLSDVDDALYRLFDVYVAFEGGLANIDPAGESNAVDGGLVPNQGQGDAAGLAETQVLDHPLAGRLCKKQ